MKKIQRYNQGFGFFGPLEKSDTGKLAFYDDIVEENLELRKVVGDETRRRFDAEEYAERIQKRLLDAMATPSKCEMALSETEETLRGLQNKYLALEHANAELGKALKAAHSKNRAKTWYLTAIVALCIGGIVAWLSARVVF